MRRASTRRTAAAVLLTIAIFGGSAAHRPALAAPSSTGRSPATTAAKVVLTGDRATFDVRHGIYEMIGHATARKAEGSLWAQRILYRHLARFLQASGQVRYESPEYVLTAGVMEYDLKREWFVARQQPEAVLRRAGQDGQTRVTADTLSFDRTREKFVAEGQVVTKISQPGREQYEVTSRIAESYYLQGRSLFRDGVRIRSSEMGANGDRAVFYEKSEKVHVLGKAKAWKVERDGSINRTIEGNHIIHDLRTGRSVALQQVLLRDAPGGPAPARSRTGPSSAAPSSDPSAVATSPARPARAPAGVPRPRRRTVRLR
ncbi:MAG: hypothetical protein HY814_10800 [Candidatus Riflebacteria bacterium]|nr:hypothetical protein [Candidatus Riflebacteria bacterium]